MPFLVPCHALRSIWGTALAGLAFIETQASGQLAAWGAPRRPGGQLQWRRLSVGLLSSLVSSPLSSPLPSLSLLPPAQGAQGRAQGPYREEITAPGSEGGTGGRPPWLLCSARHVTLHVSLGVTEFH